MIDFDQYQLWPNCNNNCKFCFNRGTPPFSTAECKQNIQDIASFIREKYIGEYVADLSLIGGEVFDTQLDDQEVKEEFYNLMHLCKQKISTGNMRRILVCTALLFDIRKQLVPYLDFMKQLGIIDHLMLCTSYDLAYRFKTVEAEQLWKRNMKALNSRRDIAVHTEMILTQFAIDAILDGSFSIKDFEIEYCTRIDFIEPTFVLYYGSKEATIADILGFFPRRSSFLKFVNDQCIQKKAIDINGLLNLKLRSKSITFKNPDGEWAFVEDRWSENCRRTDRYGNKVDIYTYCDSDLSMVDDLEMIRNSVV